MTEGATAIRVERVELRPPQATPRGVITEVWAVTAAVGSGRGRARALTGEEAHAVADAVRGWCDDVGVVEALEAIAAGGELEAWLAAWPDFEARARAGPSLLALSALDGAAWDGARRRASATAPPPRATTAVATYWSGLWLHSSIEELAAEATWAVGEGFDGAKLRVDATDVGASVDRIRAVLEVAPPGRWLALECASSGTPDAVEAIVGAVDHARLLWVEDPIPTSEVAATAELARRLPVALAAGEDCWGRAAFVERVRTVDARVPIVDLGRCGGPSALASLLGERALGDLDVGVHVDALAGADVVALTGGANRVWLEVFPWWEQTTRREVAARAQGAM